MTDGTPSASSTQVRLDDLPPPPPVSALRRMRFGLRSALPLLVWLAAIGVVVWLHTDQPAPTHAIGMAEVRQVVAAPARSGRIAAVHVVSGQTVAAGEVLAELDTVALDAELELARARLERARTRVESAREELRIDMEDRRAEAAERVAEHEAEASRLRQAAERLRADLAVDRAELAGLQPRIARLDELVGDALLPSQDHDALLQRRGVLNARAATYDAQLEAVERELRAWQELTPRPFSAADVRSQLIPLEAELEVQSARVRALEVERNDAIVRAPAAGVVSSVLRTTGEWCDPSMGLAEIVVPRPDRVLAYVRGELVTRVDVGVVAQVHPRDRHELPRAGRIVSVGPQVEELPPALRTIPTLPEYGRRVVIELESGAPLVAGEPYRVSLP